MRNVVSNPLITAGCILAAVLLASLGLEGLPSNSGCDEGVDVQIVTNRTSYAPGATMHVKLLVANTGKTSFYLFRGISQCSSPYGWLHLSLRDQHNQEVEDWGCSFDDFSVGSLNVVQFLSNPRTGLLLERGEIYGQEDAHKLPKRKGTFQLHAELAAPGLTEDQRQALAQHQMRVLTRNCVAPAVTITLK